MQAEPWPRQSAICRAARRLILCGRATMAATAMSRHGTSGRGYPVRVAALAAPISEAAPWARWKWEGPVEPFEKVERRQSSSIACSELASAVGWMKAVSQRLSPLDQGAGQPLPATCQAASPATMARCSRRSAYDLTVTFGALKPAIGLPAMAPMGRVVLADIGIEADTDVFEIDRPNCRRSIPRATNIAGTGPLPRRANAGCNCPGRRRCREIGAGYVRVSTSLPISGLPSSIVQTGGATCRTSASAASWSARALGDVPQVLTLALTAPRPIVIDADAIGLVGEPERLHGHDTILTPHEGEFRQAVRRDRRLGPSRLGGRSAFPVRVVYKGPDTLVAPGGGLARSPGSCTAGQRGTGDVLSGLVAAIGPGVWALRSACAAVWVMARPAEGLQTKADRRRSGRRHPRCTCGFMSETIVRIAA